MKLIEDNLKHKIKGNLIDLINESNLDPHYKKTLNLWGSNIHNKNKKQEDITGILNYGAFCYSTLVKYTRETNTFLKTSCKTSCKEINIFAGLLQETSCKCGTKILYYENPTHILRFVVFLSFIF